MITKRLSIALLWSLLSLTLAAQPLGTWRMYLSYYIATKSEAAGSRIYSLMNGNLLSYDTEDGDLRTYDHLGLLSDVGIKHIAYSKDVGKLLIVYGNGNIDLLSDDGNVQNLPSLKDKRILNKEVSDVSIDGHTAYLSTGFGIVEVDMAEAVFRNTYKLNISVNCIAATSEAVYIGTSSGVLQCPKSGNMHLSESWTSRFNWTGIISMRVFNGKLMAMNPNHLYSIDLSRIQNKTYSSGKYTFLKVTGGKLLWGDATKLYIVSEVTSDAATDAVEIPIANNWSDITCVSGTYWMSEQENGLRAYKIVGNEIAPTGQVIQPSSPIRDLGYNVTWVGDRLLVAGGINTIDAFYNPATSMYYENGEWTNFQEMEKPADRPKLRLSNTTDLVQDPLDASHHYASPYRTGLCEYREGKFVKLYDYTNSPLRSIISNSQRYNYVSCAALSYDIDGNLWMASSMRDTVLHILKPDGEWFNPYYEELDGVSLVDKILHHSSGLKFITSRRIDKRGIFCLDTRGTERTTDDKTKMYQTITNQDGTSYTPTDFYCLCEDLDGTVWLGTSSGLFALEDVSQVFDTDFRFTQVKINRNDGSGLADYLLNDVSIACVAVDPANRKWIGTQANGAYLISADGQEMIHHFTTDDSPLLSDNVQSIAVHPRTGEVVFGTDKGLCSFMAEATEPEAELDKGNVTVFPNPATPDYNGPIAIRGLVSDTEVKILTTGGQLVWNGTSVGGTCLWNGYANNGRRVASGIYHVVANTPEGNKAIVTRVVIVR